MLEQEGYLAMLPISMLTEGAHWSLRMLRVDIPHVPRPTGLVTVTNPTLGPLAHEFITTARAFAKSLGKVRVTVSQNTGIYTPRSCLVWVMSRHTDSELRCPLFTRKQTQIRARLMSAVGQHRKSQACNDTCAAPHLGDRGRKTPSTGSGP